MKKLFYLLITVLLFQIPVFSQTVYWEDDFIVNHGWIVGGNWSVTEGKLQFFWSPQIENFNLSTVSPVIKLIDNTNELIVSQYINPYETAENEMAEISILHDNQEDLLWSYALNKGKWGSENGGDLKLSISKYAGKDVRLKFRTYGKSTTNWNSWDVFNIKLTANLNYDLSTVKISGPSQVDLQKPGVWNVKVKNLGKKPISDFTVKLFDYKTGNLIGSVDNTEQIEPQDTKSYSFNWSSDTAYNTAFYGVVNYEGDEFVGNNRSRSHFVRINPDIDISILVWDNDNDIETVLDPEQGNVIFPSTSLKRALDLAKYDYDFVTSLPNNLKDYDIVFCSLGCYCLS